MGLTNAQYDEIMRIYDKRRIESKHRLDERVEEVYKAIPEYEELDVSVRDIATECGKRAIRGDKSALVEMQDRINAVIKDKEALLVNNGFSKDYLEPVFVCKDCEDTGYINSQKCHCLNQMIIHRLYAQSNVSDILSRENFDTLTYDYYDDSNLSVMKETIDMLKKYTENFDSQYENIIFMGRPGVGKTFLTNCIAKALLDTAHSVIYFTSVQLFDTLSKYAFSYDSSEEIAEIREDIFTCDLLIIDDLGTENSGSFAANQLFLVLNERNLRRKSTIISTNLNLSEIGEKYTDRVVSRIMGSYTFIKPDISDIRLKMRRNK